MQEYVVVMYARIIKVPEFSLSFPVLEVTQSHDNTVMPRADETETDRQRGPSLSVCFSFIGSMGPDLYDSPIAYAFFFFNQILRKQMTHELTVIREKQPIFS